MRLGRPAARGQERSRSSPRALGSWQGELLFPVTGQAGVGRPAAAPEGLGPACLLIMAWVQVCTQPYLCEQVCAQAGAGHLGIVHTRSAQGDLGTLARGAHLELGSYPPS